MILSLAAALFQRPEVPTVVQRKAVPYLSMRATVDIDGMKTVVPNTMGKLNTWMKEHKVQPKGPVFIRFIYIDMPRRLDLEVGILTFSKVKADGDVISSVIPAGRYVSLIHHGDYAGLVPPNGQLQDYARSKNLKFKMRKGDRGEEFVARFELYETDPDKEPDTSKWETNILYQVK